MDKYYDEFHENTETFNAAHFPDIETMPFSEMNIDFSGIFGDEEPLIDNAPQEEKSEKQNIKTIEKNIEQSCEKSIQLINILKPYLEKIAIADIEKKQVPVYVEVDLSLVNKESSAEYAEMWAYLMLGCVKQNNINFVFIDSGDSSSVPQNKFLELLRNNLSSKKAIATPDLDVNKFMNERVAGMPNKDALDIIRITISSKEKLEEMKTRGIDLASNQYPVAMESLQEGEGERVLMNFEAALAIGLAQATLVIAKNNKKDLAELRQKITVKLKEILKIFIRKEDFTINEDTLFYMVSEISETRVEMAIVHALPSIVKMPVDSIWEKIKLANLFLQQA
ncbi:hypothetical protein OMAG_000104 [Candidatus Omnitrophus magneticus]|uniref:Uncharacterized protein n=1 Tax=Candidatus Omnitrophus magneticus TaxID=1609969 RepID=A0A0F0CRW3_9BACT|nr:hypothetical protein OMAG_000104 [Candidatus Omnitrophus magneticus]